MDLSKLANLAEIFGTAAIVVSLIYVAIQIRQNTRAMKLAAAQNVSQDVQNGLSFIAGDTEFARIHLEAMSDIDSLAAAERHRFYVFLMRYLRTFENAYHQNKAGLLDEYVWDGFSEQIKLASRTSGYCAFWRDRHQYFGQEFQDFYNGLSPTDPAIAVDPYKESTE